MSKKLLIFIIVLVGLALAGIVYVQISYMKNAYAQNETLFDYKVNNALQSVVSNLDQIEMVEKIQVGLQKKKLRQVEEKHDKNPFHIQIDSFFEVKFNDTLIENIRIPDVQDIPEMDEMIWTFNDENLIVISNEAGRNHKKLTVTSGIQRHPLKRKTYIFGNDTIFRNSHRLYLNDANEFRDSVFSYRFNNEYIMNKELALFNEQKKEQELALKKAFADQKKKQIKKVVSKMVVESDKQLVREVKKLNYLLIDSILKASIQNHDIALPYEYTVITDSANRKEIPSTPGFQMNTRNKKYEAMLFPNDIVPKPDKIIIYFPERSNHLVKSLSILLPASLFFSLIIIIAFTISIMMVLRQKKLSDIKSDFINNMTHEFKTPIATISLAADTIVNPKVIGDQNRVSQFIGIIKDENKRMNLQVERILQMAQLERKELELKLEKTDIHQLINKAIQNIDVQIRQLNGNLTTGLEAEDHIILIDEVHFTNVVNNLLDNALKYTESPPEIAITSTNIENSILLSFEDKGIGMTKEAQSKIFEKFYRVSKGNIHNVKGFGLGLSYVKAIIEAHSGRITVKSELNKGSRFDIFLPIKSKESGKST